MFYLNFLLLLYLPQSSSDINGIIHQIPSISVSATSSSNNLDTLPIYPISLSSTYYWCSSNSDKQFIKISFPSNKIWITNYSIQVGNWPSTGNHPRTWILEGSKDGNTWSILDKVIDSQINSPNRVQTRSCSSGLYQYFKFTHYGINYYSSPLQYHFCIYKLDFFGSVHDLSYSIPAATAVPPVPTCPLAATCPNAPTFPIAATCPNAPTFPIAATCPNAPTFPIAATCPNAPTCPNAATCPSYNCVLFTCNITIRYQQLLFFIIYQSMCLIVSTSMF